jgi:hypothetical protein
MGISLDTGPTSRQALSMEINALRTAYGASAAPWTVNGRHRVEDTHWLALSSARDGANQALIHVPSSSVIAGIIDELNDAKLRSIAFVAGGALADVQTFIDAGWVCIGARPFMARSASPGVAPASDSAGSALREPQTTTSLTDLDEARAIVAEAFEVDEAAGVALLPESVCSSPDADLWTARDSTGRMLGCAVTSRVGDVLTIWDVATPLSARHSGAGVRIMQAIHNHAVRLGDVRLTILSSSTNGVRFWLRQGYEPLEYWQLWSRPRWVLGRR